MDVDQIFDSISVEVAGIERSEVEAVDTLVKVSRQPYFLQRETNRCAKLNPKLSVLLLLNGPVNEVIILFTYAA